MARVFNSPSTVFNTVRKINDGVKRCNNVRDHHKEIPKNFSKSTVERKRSIFATSKDPIINNRIQDLVSYLSYRRETAY